MPYLDMHKNPGLGCAGNHLTVRQRRGLSGAIPLGPQQPRRSAWWQQGFSLPPAAIFGVHRAAKSGLAGLGATASGVAGLEQRIGALKTDLANAGLYGVIQDGQAALGAMQSAELTAARARNADKARALLVQAGQRISSVLSSGHRQPEVQSYANLLQQRLTHARNVVEGHLGRSSADQARYDVGVRAAQEAAARYGNYPTESTGVIEDLWSAAKQTAKDVGSGIQYTGSKLIEGGKGVIDAGAAAGQSAKTFSNPWVLGGLAVAGFTIYSLVNKDWG